MEPGQPLRNSFGARWLRTPGCGLLASSLALFAATTTSHALGSFTRHLAITVGANVIGGSHANFPLLVDLSNPELRTAGNGGQVQSANGYDIVFRGEDGGVCGGPASCMLDHEIELYDGAAGRIVAWVRMPSLANGRVIHMYYGNNLITSSTEATGAVFDADYIGVWHLKESGNGTLNEYRDSSRYANHGQGGQGDANAVPKQVAGKIGYAQRFDKLADSTYDFVDAGQDGTLNITGNQITLQAWVQHSITVNTPHGCANPPYTSSCPGGGVSAPYGILNHKGYWDGYRLYLDGDALRCPNPSGTLTDPCLAMGIPEQTYAIKSSQYGGFPYTGPGATDPVTKNEWHHVVAAYDGAEMRLYVDGVKLRAEGLLLYSTGTASVAMGSPTVTFAGATLPASVGPGLVLTFRGPNVENLIIQSRDSATQVTLTTPAVAAHINQSYRITTPFRTGNVSPSLAQQHVWIGHGDQPQNVGWSSEFEGDIDEVRISRVARSDDWIATEYANQNSPATFSTVGAPAIVAQGLATPTTVYRSIGTNAAVLHSTGDASVPVNGTVVTFAGGASLPANVGQGDRIDFTGGSPETLFILSRDSATQVTVQTPAAFSHTNETYMVGRAYNTLQAWEDALPPDLVAANVREVGVAYNDDPFTAGVVFSGSVTDPTRDIRLTASLDARQRGVPSLGVVLDNGSAVTPAITLSDDHVTVEFFEIKGGGAAGAHGIELAGVNAANLCRVRHNLIHDSLGDGIRLSDADAVVDVYNNFIFNTNVGIRLLVDMSPAARVNIFSNTVFNNATAGVASRDAGGAYVRQTSLRVDLRQDIAHSSPVDLDVARPFDEAYFCSGLSGTDPTGCTDVTAPLRDQTTNVILPFNGASSCLYLGSTESFRGVGASLSAGGPSANLQWDYWNGTSWASLETGAFEDYNFQWDGFAYWPDDPAGWATRQGSAPSWPAAPGGASQRYYVRVCRFASNTSPTERLIARADVSVASRYNIAKDKTGLYHSLWPALGTTGVESTVGPIGAGVSFTSATDLHLQSTSVARDVVLDAQRPDAYLGTPGRESSALSGRFTLDVDLQARPLGANGACFASPSSCWDIGADEVGADANMDLAINKDDFQATAVPGDPVSYTITVTNNGPDTVTSLFVNDVPADILGPVFTPSVGTYNSGTGEWTGLNLAPTEFVTLTLSGTINPFARGSLVNTATVLPPAGAHDPNTNNNTSTDTDTLVPSVDLALTKTGAPEPVGLGSVLTYTLDVTNGPSGATGVTLTDTLPPNMLYESATPTQGSCSYDGPTRTVTCNLGSVGASAQVTLRVRPLAVGAFLNTATVQGTEDPGPGGNNTGSWTTHVQVFTSDVRFFTATSTNEQNVLEWVNPTADYVETEIRYRTDGYPKDASDGTLFYKGGVAGGQEKQTHFTGPGSNGVTYYYGAFVHRTSPLPDSSGRFVTARPFDHTTGPVKWSFSTGATALSPPTVGGAGVVAPSNDRILYAMQRGALSPGGEWPANWWPIELGGVVQSRSPVVPIFVLGANPVVYLGAQDGSVYAVDATKGSKGVSFLWQTPLPPIGTIVQAAPAGIFTDFSGAFDYLLVGTRNSTLDNTLFLLNPSTGSPLGGGFTNGGGAGLGIGIINTMAAVDYRPPPRVYFTSYRSTIGGSPNTLWCLELTGTSPFFELKWARDLDDIDGSPVLRSGRVYVGSARNGGTVFSIDAANGGDERSFPHGDGQVKGFVFPDRHSPTGDIYFATNNYVWGVTDDAGVLSDKFASGISLGAGIKPSPVLFVPGSHYVYAGGSDGRLYEVDAATGTVNIPVVLGDGSAVVGAPSLDWVNKLVHVGTEAGIFYAVQVPLPGATCVPAASCTAGNVGQPCYTSDPATECSLMHCLGAGVCGP